MTAAQPAEERRLPAALLLAGLLLVGSTVSWRQGAYYSGGVDPVVAGKALMSIAALAIAFGCAARSPVRYRRSTAASWFLFVSVVVSLFGAWTTAGNFRVSVIDALRILIVAAAAFELTRAYRLRAVLKALIVSGGLIVGLAVATAYVSPLVHGPAGAVLPDLRGTRLTGAIPPLAPNEIAELSGLVVIAVTWRLVHERIGRRDIAVLLGFLALVYLTGSRTGFAALAVAVVLMVGQKRRLPMGVVLAGYTTVAIGAVVGFGSRIAADFVGRGGSANVSTLSDRTVAWSAALHIHHGFWAVWFGNGLAQLQVPVVARFRTEQILDSSWISALVQGGVIGLVVLVLWGLYGLRVVARGPRPFRLLSVALMVFILLRSFLESGLLAATPALLIFYVLSAGAGGVWGPARDRIEPDAVFARAPRTVAAATRVA